ncbi:DUF6114 domain-containing protein [Rhodococcus sp. IEGM 1408]|uniref:DUF6114 domain-containing protein n=1 Tax=Rhodococcus sp. IEGM 1408 TaxID=3082220 RepID=UPI00295360D7|nr:DUF6114 domain-containing protein [Rhodococcus sp. IEGM 1408]MDV8001385.1 DUF6114 domain-containing protein [Rhodococcus sp. IEGM 1408]
MGNARIELIAMNATALSQPVHHRRRQGCERMLIRLPADARTRFRDWRGGRPFWGAATVLVSGLFLLLPAYTSFHVGDVLINISTIAGLSTLFLGAFMFLRGALSLLRPTRRVPTGVGAGLILTWTRSPTAAEPAAAQELAELPELPGLTPTPPGAVPTRPSSTLRRDARATR